MAGVDQVEEIVMRWRQLAHGLDPSPMLVVGRIHRLARIMDAALRPTFAEAGLGEGDFNILAALARAPAADGLAAGELHRALMVSTGGITKQVDRLADRGLVMRRVGAVDGRVRRVALTPAGRELVHELMAVHLDRQRELLAGLGAHERAALADTLGALARALEPESRP